MNKLHRILRYELPLHFVLLITNWLPDNVIFIRLRGILARPFFKSCGGKLGIGRNVTFYNSWKMVVGSHVYIAYGCWLGGDLSIEDEVMFGPYCVLAPTNHTREYGSYRFGGNTVGQIIVKKGSWIGSHSSIVQGGILGKGCVLAANSVLNTETEDYSIYGGVPAKKIKSYDP